MSFRFLYQQMILEMQKQKLGDRLVTVFFTYIEASPLDPQEGGGVKKQVNGSLVDHNQVFFIRSAGRGGPDRAGRPLMLHL